MLHMNIEYDAKNSERHTRTRVMPETTPQLTTPLLPTLCGGCWANKEHNPCRSASAAHAMRRNPWEYSERHV
jgi:hypothetical protein